MWRFFARTNYRTNIRVAGDLKRDDAMCLQCDLYVIQDIALQNKQYQRQKSGSHRSKHSRLQIHMYHDNIGYSLILSTRLGRSACECLITSLPKVDDYIQLKITVPGGLPDGRAEGRRQQWGNHAYETSSSHTVARWFEETSLILLHMRPSDSFV